MMGNIEGKRKRGQQRMRWLNVITLNGHLFEQTHRDSEGQRKPACCRS